MIEILIGITVGMWIGLVVIGIWYFKESREESKRHEKLTKTYNV